jgi:hypothetical protein
MRRGGFNAMHFFVSVAAVSLIAYALLSVFEESRMRARNTVRNEAVGQYTRALQFIYADHGVYPKVDAACLGDYHDDRCWVLDHDIRGDIVEIKAFNERLGSLIPLSSGGITGAEREDGSRTSYEGYIYRVIDDGAGYRIEWMLESEDARCGLNADAEHRYNGFDMTHCIYTSYAR